MMIKMVIRVKSSVILKKINDSNIKFLLVTIILSLSQTSINSQSNLTQVILPTATPSSNNNTSTAPIAPSTILSFELPPSSSQTFHLPPTPSSSSNPVETFITLNICSIPSSLNVNQLEFSYSDSLIISNSSDLQNPSIDNLPTTQARSTLLKNRFISPTGDRADFQAGYASSSLLNTAGLWINVRAPSISTSGAANNPSSSSNFALQLGVSTVAPVHASHKVPAFKLEDSDDQSVLLTAADSSLFLPSTEKDPISLSQAYPVILPTPPRLSIGLSGSLCSLQAFNASTSPANYIRTSNMVPSLTIRGTGLGMISSQLTSNLSEAGSRISPERAGKRTQYLVSGLRPDTNYTAWYFQPGPVVSNIQTGKLWPYINFRTKASNKCKLVFDLPFCPNVAYSVPTPPGMTVPSLVQSYNQKISGHLANFSTVISTYPCNNDTSGRYSFVSGCGDCLRAYNDWACSVMMPRCTDPPPATENFANSTRITGTGLKLQQPDPTNLNGATVLTRLQSNLSRTSQISDRIYPYGEIPPCLSTCTLVQATCPSFLQFKCPSQSVSDLTNLNYGPIKFLNEVELSGGQNFGKPLRAGDRFGNVFCNGLDSDLSYSRISRSDNFHLEFFRTGIYLKLIVLSFIWTFKSLIL